MYSSPSISVDKGLGFDFSNITNLVKTALPVGLSVYQNQMELKKIKAGQQYIPSLPITAPMQIQPTVRPVVVPVEGGSDGTVWKLVLLIGGTIVGGVVLYKIFK